MIVKLQITSNLYYLKRLEGKPMVCSSRYTACLARYLILRLTGKSSKWRRFFNDSSCERGRSSIVWAKQNGGVRKWSCCQGRAQINRPSRPMSSLFSAEDQLPVRYTKSTKTKIRSQSASLAAHHFLFISGAPLINK